MGRLRSAPFAGTRMNSRYRQSFYAGLIRIIANMLMVCAIFCCCHVLFSSALVLACGSRVQRGIFRNNHSSMDDCLLAYAPDTRRIFPRLRKAWLTCPGVARAWCAGSSGRALFLRSRGETREISWGSACGCFMGAEAGLPHNANG